MTQYPPGPYYTYCLNGFSGSCGPCPPPGCTPCSQCFNLVPTQQICLAASGSNWPTLVSGWTYSSVIWGDAGGSSGYYLQLQNDTKFINCTNWGFGGIPAGTEACTTVGF